MNPQLRDRVILPFAIPVGAVALIGVFVFFFSRILLVVGKDMAVVVALAAAVDILVVCAIVAARPPTPATYRLAAVVGIGVIAAGALAMRGAATPAHPPENGAPAPTVPAPSGIQLAASGLVFTGPKELTASAGEETKVELRNQDASTPHNFAVYRDSSLAETIFKGELFNGVATRTYTFTAPAAGDYFYQCDVHPTTMTGTLKVT